MLLIVGQRIRAAWVTRSAQLDEDFHCRAIARGFGLGDIDGLRIEIDRVNLAARIELIPSYAPHARIGSTSLLRRISLHSASPSQCRKFCGRSFGLYSPVATCSLVFSVPVTSPMTIPAGAIAVAPRRRLLHRVGFFSLQHLRMSPSAVAH